MAESHALSAATTDEVPRPQPVYNVGSNTGLGTELWAKNSLEGHDCRPFAVSNTGTAQGIVIEHVLLCTATMVTDCMAISITGINSGRRARMLSANIGY